MPNLHRTPATEPVPKPLFSKPLCFCVSILLMSEFKERNIVVPFSGSKRCRVSLGYYICFFKPLVPFLATSGFMFSARERPGSSFSITLVSLTGGRDSV